MIDGEGLSTLILVIFWRMCSDVLGCVLQLKLSIGKSLFESCYVESCSYKSVTVIVSVAMDSTVVYAYKIVGCLLVSHVIITFL